jgi:hypothetical protein
MIRPIATKLINITLYQLGWFCCVLGATWANPVLGALLAMVFAGVHLLLTDQPKNECIRMLGAGLIGIIVDSIQQYLGIITFTSHPDWPLWLPLWVFVIWAQFATLFRYGLYWLSGRYFLAISFGVIGGPLAYWGGVRLGAAAFGDHLLLSLLSLALVWGVVTPAFFWLSSQFGDGEGRYRWGGTLR